MKCKRFIKTSTLWLTLLFSFSTLSGYAKVPPIYLSTQVIRGNVLDKNTQVPLSHVTVQLFSKDQIQTVLTDSSGDYSFKDVAFRRCQLTFSITGYHSQVFDNVLVLTGKETVVNVFLEEKILEMENVTVISGSPKYAARNVMATASARIFSSEEADRFAGSWGDPARMAANLAGVASVSDNRNDIIIRGNSPTGLLWRLDGFDIPNPNHFGALGGTGGPISMLNNNQLTNSDFYTGAFPAEFGNATSGVFDLKLKNGNNRRSEYMAGIGFNGIEGGAEGPLSKRNGSSYIVNARYSFLGLMKKLKMDVGTGESVPKYYDLNAKLNFPVKNGNVSFLALWGNSSIRIQPEIKDDAQNGDIYHDTRLKNSQLFTGINYTHRFTNNTRLENRLSYQFFKSGVDVVKQTYPQQQFTAYFKDTTFESRLAYKTDLHHKFSIKNIVAFGLGCDIYFTNLRSLSAEDGKMVPTHHSQKKSALVKGYIQWLHRFNNKLNLMSGGYSQLYTLNNDFSIDPRIGLKWSVSNRSAFNFATGVYSQLQQRLAYFYRRENTYLNKNMGMSKSWQTIAGYNTKLLKDMNFKAEIYYQYLFNVPVIPKVPQESILNIGDDFYNDWNHEFVNKGTGRNYGIDITIEKSFNKNYYFLVTGSLYQARYTGFDKTEHNSRFAGNYSLNALAGYEWKLGPSILMSVNTKMAYFGGKRYVPSVIQQTGEVPVKDYTRAYENRLPDYFRMDLNFNMKQQGKKYSNEWFFECNNITNHKNILTSVYNAAKQKEEFVYQVKLSFMGGARFYF